MSEFECRNGHLMIPSLGMNCHICGAPVARMDGKSNSELAYEDKMYDAYCIAKELERERDVDALLEDEENEEEVNEDD